MGLADLLKPEYILLDGPSLSKDEMIRSLVEPLAAAGVVSSGSSVTRALFERERIMSTGVGGGVALPHALSPAVNSFAVAIGRPKDPIDFQALDGKPVTMIFLAIGPDDRTGLMRVLTRISRLLYTGDLQKNLIKADSPAAIIQLIADEEHRLIGEGAKNFPGKDGKSG
jgi:mannitol/fructose-specific phosphotransferase system IIA component (Ntr-type)